MFRRNYCTISKLLGSTKHKIEDTAKIRNVISFANQTLKGTIHKARSRKIDWENMSVQLQFMQILANKLNISDNDGWYNVGKTTLRNNGGGKLLDMYQGSVLCLLSSVFPGYLKFN